MTAPSPIRDLWLRVLLSPVLGAAVAHGAGIITTRRHGRLFMAADYLAFAGIAFLVWEGNRRLYFALRVRLATHDRLGRRVAVTAAVQGLFTVASTIGLLAAWSAVSADPSASWSALGLAAGLSAAAVAVITHGYETVFLARDRAAERLHLAQLERARIQAELDALQRETDPHFLYNSLNSLMHLIETDRARALTFVEALAAGYRYLLETRRWPLVPLVEEFAALRRLQSLNDIRYHGAVRLNRAVTDEQARAWRLPPLCLLELVQNAVKHTTFGVTNPLIVQVELVGDELIVSNRLQPRREPAASTGVGLDNLSERVRLAVGRPVRCYANAGAFVVHVPLARMAEAPGNGPHDAEARVDVEAATQRQARDD